MNDMWVSDYMSREVVTCPGDTILAEVVEELHSNLFSCLVVVDGDKPIGLINERHLVAVFADILGQANWGDMKVENFMNTPVKTIASDLTLVEAVTAMKEFQLRHVPVVDSQGKLAGILTQTDIIRGFYDAALEAQ
jgi:CBS domain-containing protein